MKNKPTQITVYSTVSCPYCKMEKEWLDSKGIQHNVIFVDLSPKDAQEMVEKTGQMGVPVTEIRYEDKETEYVIGFDQHQLAHILEV